MRVACPECAAEYVLPPALAARLGDGKTVRCARCGTTWAPPPPPDDVASNGLAPNELALGSPPDLPAPATDAAPSPESALRFPDPPPSAAAPPPLAPPPAEAGADTSRFVLLAWASSLLLLAGAAAAAWTWRIDLVEAWPPAARAFIALGLAG